MPLHPQATLQSKAPYEEGGSDRGPGLGQPCGEGKTDRGTESDSLSLSLLGVEV